MSLAIAGADRMTDRSPADLTAVVTNASAAAVTVHVQADAGRNPARVAKSSSELAHAADGNTISVQVNASSSTLVYVQVKALDPVRRGKVSVAVIATVHPALTEAKGKKTSSTQVVATRELTADLAGAGLLPAAVSGGATLLVPGVLAVWASLQVWVIDRRRLGVPTPNAAESLWDNKLWLLLGVLVSLASVWAYSTWFGQDDLLDTYRWLDLVRLSIGTAFSAAVLSGLTLFGYRRWRPPINKFSDPWKVLQAAAKYKDQFDREVYEASDGVFGLLVHHDRGLVVLTPPICFNRPDELVEYSNARNLKAAVEAIKVAKKAAKKNHAAEPFDGRWGLTAAEAVTGPWVSKPVVIAAKPPAPRAAVRILGFGCRAEE
ncbi:hypothetical protein ACH419_30545 [Streptomyces bobili]|uniref:hypothetical protein n=1 Tax=Streptomyces bobili TaxID=67280 RepID=UPI0037BD8C83